MAHELTIREDQSAEMAYVGAAPWHGLGQQLESGATLDEWLKAAGMDWRILRSRIRYATGPEPDAELRTLDDSHVFFRSDTHDALGIGSDKFRLVQPAAVLKFFHDVADSAGLQLETAGTLFGGRKFWALARVCPDAVIHDQDDRVGGYLLLCTACDGTMPTEARRTTVRVVCNNTLQDARFGTGVVKVSHRVVFDPDRTRAELGIGPETKDEFGDAIDEFRRLADTRISRLDAVEATATVFRPEFATLTRAEQDKILRSKPVCEVGSLFMDGRARGSGFNGVQGTAWGWLNAVTEYVDHAGRARTPSARLDSAWFGKGNEIKQCALQMAVQMADGTMQFVGAVQPQSDAPSDLARLLNKPLAF